MKTRDVVLPGKLVRTSHKPSPDGRHSGMPTGQRYCTLSKSAPISSRSTRPIAFNHSRTGSLPPAVRQKPWGFSAYSDRSARYMVPMYCLKYTDVKRALQQKVRQGRKCCRPGIEDVGAGEGNRTLVVSLGSGFWPFDITRVFRFSLCYHIHRFSTRFADIRRNSCAMCQIVPKFAVVSPKSFSAASVVSFPRLAPQKRDQANHIRQTSSTCTLRPTIAAAR